MTTHLSRYLTPSHLAIAGVGLYGLEKERLSFLYPVYVDSAGDTGVVEPA